MLCPGFQRFRWEFSLEISLLYISFKKDFGISITLTKTLPANKRFCLKLWNSGLRKHYTTGWQCVTRVFTQFVITDKSVKYHWLLHSVRFVYCLKPMDWYQRQNTNMLYFYLVSKTLLYLTSLIKCQQSWCPWYPQVRYAGSVKH